MADYLVDTTAAHSVDDLVGKSGQMSAALTAVMKVEQTAVRWAAATAGPMVERRGMHWVERLVARWVAKLVAEWAAHWAVNLVVMKGAPLAGN